MAILNPFFEKKQSQKVNYSSGGGNTQIDYLLDRRQLLKVLDCRVLPNESVARQHRPVVCRLKRELNRIKRRKGTKKTRWWKLNEQEHRKEFEQKMVTKIQEIEDPSWKNLSEEMRKSGREMLGESLGKTKQSSHGGGMTRYKLRSWIYPRLWKLPRH